MANFTYRAEIDGLRAIAVISVVLFHLGLGFPGGFIGVDIFFVISGFLITGILQRSIQNKTFSLQEFWEKRIRRILPALCAVLISTLLIGCWILTPNELEDLGKSSIAQALLSANIFFWLDTGYFDGESNLKPLLHTWSLAVEEQFYLFFPLLLLALKNFNRLKVLRVISLLTLISFALSVYGNNFYPSAAFFLLPTRAWELLIGCTLSLIPNKSKPSPWRDNIIGSLGCLGVILPIFMYDENTPFPGLAAIPPVIGTALIIYATENTPHLWLHKILSIRPLTIIGLISYSLYLWHWPTIVFTRIYFGKLELEQIIFALLTSVILSIISYILIETPFRKNIFHLHGIKTWAIALFANLTLIITSGILDITEGLPFRFSDYSLVLVNDVSWNGSEFDFKKSDHLILEELPTLGVRKTQRASNPDFVVWGDSHGMVLCDVINSAAENLNLCGKAIVTPAFLPVPDVNLITNNILSKNNSFLCEQVLDLLDQVRPNNLILVARWSRYTGFTNTTFGEQPIFPIDSRFGKENKAAIEIIKRNMQELISFCAKRNISLWIIKQVPETGEIAPAQNLISYMSGRIRNLSDEKKTEAEHQRMVSAINNVFDKLSREYDVNCLDFSSLLLLDRQTINYFEDRAVYRDYCHLTRHGLDLVRPFVVSMLNEIKKSLK